MKKPFTLILTILLVSICAASLAQGAIDIDAVLAQAEKVLASPYGTAPEVGENNPMPEGLKITGPFLYVGRADMESEIFMPDGNSHEYFPSGLSDGAKLYAADISMIKDIYPNLVTDDAGAPVVYALLFGTGYYNGNKYQGDLTVCDQDWDAVFVDYASGEIVAWTDGIRYYGGPYMLYGKDYFTDMNGRAVYNRENIRQLRSVWRDTLLYASADPTGAVIKGGVLVSMSNKEIEAYTVPDGVTEIGEQAFEYCDKLQSVTFPRSVKTIGWLAFGGCAQLERISFSQGLTKIDINAFNGCEALDNVVLPEGLTTIGIEAFVDCASLRDITFPSTLTEVGNSAFGNTPWLAERASEPFVIVGDGVLIKANVPDGGDVEAMKDMIAEFGDRFDWGEIADYAEAFGELPMMDELVIPDGVKYLAGFGIAEVAVKRLVLPGTLAEFWGAEDSLWNVAVEEIYVSDGVTRLPYEVFRDCHGLRRVRLPESLSWFQDFSRYDVDKQSITVVAPEGSRAYAEARNSGYQVEAE